MILLFRAVLYMLVRYASLSGPMCFRCMIFTLSCEVVVLLYCLLDLC